jgi:murein DD-endopeptidase MepM/ murein hydrolase activator NlpD
VPVPAISVASTSFAGHGRILPHGRLRRLACGAVLACLLAACASPRVGPGYYRVKSGDTLTRIARDHNQSVSNLMRWNKLDNPNQIDTGQVLRVEPPEGSAKATERSPARSGAKPDTDKATAAAPADKTPLRGIALIWPAQGSVAQRFGASSPGLRIVNAAGTPVIAAAAGTVAYASNGLRGYGNLVIIRHSSDFLTIYAHNRTLAVKQGQRVTQGQKIAEMGNSDSKRVELYFELRQGGKPVDPARALPPR